MAKKACLEEDGSEGWFSDKSDESEYAYPFGADLLDEYAKGASDNMEEDSFSYGSLAYANYAGVSLCSSAKINGEEPQIRYWLHA